LAFAHKSQGVKRAYSVTDIEGQLIDPARIHSTKQPSYAKVAILFKISTHPVIARLEFPFLETVLHDQITPRIILKCKAARTLSICIGYHLYGRLPRGIGAAEYSCFHLREFPVEYSAGDSQIGAKARIAGTCRTNISWVDADAFSCPIASKHFAARLAPA